ncbi:hypothetical protein L1987_23220 [Smallanthus sonchifolius]|uniref:Uncharacterized protein n=1 Tax=Smallanthus sonchifolius TaxID=185202 RepID=A0ACB9IGB3_9ASTR|nr:hypothetical protein L1987_23220 [Smallanthus sonchifolius]
MEFGRLGNSESDGGDASLSSTSAIACGSHQFQSPRTTTQTCGLLSRNRQIYKRVGNRVLLNRSGCSECWSMSSLSPCLNLFSISPLSAIHIQSTGIHLRLKRHVHGKRATNPGRQHRNGRQQLDRWNGFRNAQEEEWQEKIPPSKPNPKVVHEFDTNRHSKPYTSSGLFKDVLTGNQTSPVNPPVINIHIPVTTAEKNWMNLSLLGEASSLSSLIEVKNRILSIEDMDVNNLQFERIAWVRIRGIPPQLWEDEVFDSIARKYGEIMQGTLASTNDGNLASDMVAIMVTDGLTVKGEAKIVRNGTTTSCWITEVNEDWVLWESTSSVKPSGNPSQTEPSSDKVVNNTTQVQSPLEAPASPIGSCNYVGPVVDESKIRVSGGMRFRKRPHTQLDQASPHEAVQPFVPPTSTYPVFPNHFLPQQKSFKGRHSKFSHRKLPVSSSLPAPSFSQSPVVTTNVEPMAFGLSSLNTLSHADVAIPTSPHAPPVIEVLSPLAPPVTEHLELDEETISTINIDQSVI